MKLLRIIPVLAFSGLTILVSAVFLMSGSEAHIINVTAKIEAPMCDARSLGYWANNEGCSHGAGSADWADEVHALSEEYSDVYTTLTGGDMCAALWMPNCSPLVPGGARKCRAIAHTLAVEMNVAANRLHRSAFLAGAYDGDPAFSRLHLFESSTIHEALITLESILENPDSTSVQFHDAAHVAMRIYTFYEEENPFHPRCVFDPDDIPACRPARGDVTVTNENTAEVSTVVEATAETGDNSAEGGEGSAGDAGTIETGEATSEVIVENEINTNTTDVSCDNCEPCGETCAEVQPTEEAPPVVEEQSEDVSVSEEPAVEEHEQIPESEEPAAQQPAAESTPEESQ